MQLGEPGRALPQTDQGARRQLEHLLVLGVRRLEGDQALDEAELRAVGVERAPSGLPPSRRASARRR